MIITIDGPAGSGKSTIARLLASKLNIEYIDSGALYRSLTWFGLQNFETLEGNQTQIVEMFEERRAEFKVSFAHHQQTICLGDDDISQAIREPSLTQNIRYIANHPDCREVVNQMIRELAQQYSVVVDGRDIGTVVFPESKNKFYLDAAPSTRALRRAKEQGTPETGPKFKALIDEITSRDQSDMNRAVAPLSVPDDATVIDTDKLSVDQVLESLEDRLES